MTTKYDNDLTLRLSEDADKGIAVGVTNVSGELQWAIAATGAAAIATLKRGGSAGDRVAGELLSKHGTIPAIASGACTIGAQVVIGAGGKWADGASNWICMAGATADGEEIQVARNGV